MAALNNDDWRSGCKDIIDIQNKARNEALFTDIQFVTRKEDSRKAFNAHKAILACGSPVFEKMFYGELAEKRGVIEIYDDPEAFEMLLNYIYGKCNKITSFVIAWKYFTIGDKYLVPKIQEDAKTYIESVSLNDNGYWDLIENNIFSSPLFSNKVKSYIEENASKLINSEKFLNLPEIIVDSMLQMDTLNVQEYKLFLAVTKWGYENINQANSENLKKFYKHIRFSNLTSNEYFQFIDSYPNAIDAQSNLEILQHLHNPSSKNLPKWCSRSKESRIKSGDAATTLTIPNPYRNKLLVMHRR